MHSRTSGPIATILMFIPLLAVPLLAVFGIPQFAPGVALRESSEDGPLAADQSLAPASERPERHSPAEDLFAPFDEGTPLDDGGELDAVGWEDPFQHSILARPAETAGRAPIRPVAATLSPRWQAEPIRRPRSPFDPPVQAPSAPLAELITIEDATDSDRERPGYSTMPVVFETGSEASVARAKQFRAQPPAETLTWQMAVRRLTELGIHDFQLEPGIAANQFQFRCSFTPAENPRVMHQFQAEAAEPLLAVQDVLNQIEGWQGTR